MNATLKELIDRAPWREAVTYRDTWPHEYVLSEKSHSLDGQEELLAAVVETVQGRRGGGLPILPDAQHVPVSLATTSTG